MDFLFVMDPLVGVNPTTDTTYALMRRAKVAGHRTFFAQAKDLSLRSARPWVKATEVAIPGQNGATFLEVTPTASMPLDAFQVAWLRTDSSLRPDVRGNHLAPGNGGPQEDPSGE